MKPIALILFLILSFNVYANKTDDWFDRGKTAYNTKNYKQAAKWFLKAAEQGDSAAQYNIGRMYFDGRGVPQDYKQGIKWLTKAAEQGDVISQLYLGTTYNLGTEVAQDYKQGIKWLTKAAEQGNPAAQHSLGFIYYNGSGVIPSNKKSYVWFSLAATNGNNDALNGRNIIAKKLSPSGLEEAQEEAAKLYDKINGNN